MPKTIEQVEDKCRELEAAVFLLRQQMDILIDDLAPMVDIDCKLVGDALLDFVPRLAEDPVMGALAGVINPVYRADFIPALRLRARIGVALNREISLDDKRKLREALGDDEWMEKVRHEIALRSAAESWTDFKGITEWLKEHWLQILQILVALLPLFLTKNPS